MKKNFDNKKYFLKEKEKILEILNDIKERIYIEVGGKIIDDQHAARVFVGYNPDNKYEIIKSLNVDFEMIICINSISIIKNKKRKDNCKLYMDEVLRLINIFVKDNIKFNISITRYRKNSKIDNYIKKLKNLGYNVYKQFEDSNYPYNIKEVFSKDGIFKNEYIPCKEKLVFVVGPGANSGKFATCISQIAYENKTLYEYFSRRVGLSEEKSRSILSRFKFKGDTINKKLKNLSGGERMRLKLAELLQQEVNTLIFDEPTNHIDIPTKEVFEEALDDFGGTLIFVSHDRFFINKYANKVIVFEDGKIKEYIGNYDSYKETIAKTDEQEGKKLYKKTKKY